jgi:hypothetical protein
MGTSYNRPISQWSKGEYAGANNTEDDLAVMQSHGATLGADDVPSQRSAAMPVSSGVEFGGFIGTAADTDWFSIAGSGQISVVANVAPISPNLDLRAEVYDANGELVAASDPASATISGDSATGLAVNLSANLPASGTYYVKLDGVGNGDPLSNGYSDYDSIGYYALTVTVLDPSNAPQVTTSSLPTANSFGSYSTQLSATSGVPPYNWGLDSSSAPLPSTLSIAANTGVISGTPSAAAGLYPLTFKVVDADGNSSTKTLTLTVADAPLSITTTLPLAPASLTKPYSLQLGASGGRGSYAWSLASGSLPAGLSMNSAGLISGTPTKAATYSFTLKVTSGTASVTKALSLAPTAAVAVTTNSLAVGLVGVSYSASLAATGGTKSYVWDLVSGTLPPGLNLVGGKISGTPTTRGSYPFVVSVTDTAGRSATSAAVTLTVSVPLQITTTALPGATKGVAYSLQLAGDGGIAPYTWAFSSRTIPAGMSLSSSGTLSGTPTVAGTYSLSIKMTAKNRASVTKTFSLVIAP